MRKPRGMVPSTCGGIEQFYHNVDTVGAGDNFKMRIDVLELPDAYFWAVHPLDSVKIEGWIGHDRDRMLDALAWSISIAIRHPILKKLA